ncbi:unnamed protein product [Euphydryas editha]|uniref:Uncharacterized protein n=1 Tax=Euphydryas editha TaxID=104508 RepID=A0AAU9TCS9_EUPED|nr:unnamed protein product [Euphydryas editha]
MITTQKLSLDCVKIIDNLLKENKEVSPVLESLKHRHIDYFRPLYAQAALELGKICVNNLKEDLSNKLSSIYIPFAEAFNDIFDQFNFDPMNKLNALKLFLEFKDFVPGYLFVMKTLPRYGLKKEEEALKSELIEELRTHPSEEIKKHFNSYPYF